MLNFFLEFLAYIFIWMAVYIGRSDFNEIKIFSKNWFIVVILIVIAEKIIISINCN